MEYERIGLQSQVSEKKGSCSKYSPLERRLLLVLTVTIIVGVGLCIAVAATSKVAQMKLLNETNRICLSPQCIQTASDLLHSLNTSQKACEDFYSFVCDNWIKNSYLVGDIVTQFSRLNNIITLRIKDVLETFSPTLMEHENKTHSFYNACMDMVTRNEDSFDILSEDIEKFGGWPMIDNRWNVSLFNWAELMVKFFHSGYPFDIMLSMGVDMDIRNISSTLISVGPPVLGLAEARHFLFDVDDKTLQRYKALILDVATRLHPDLDTKVVEESINEAVKVEKKLAKASIKNPQILKPSDYYNIKTLKAVEKLTPKIPWRYLLKNLLPQNTIIQDDQKVMIISPSNLIMLNELLEEYEETVDKKRELANYMMYRAVMFAAPHLDTNTFFLSEYRLRPTAGSRQLWQICSETTAQVFHLSLTVSYAERYLDSETRSELEMMYQDLQVAVMEDIEQAKWLDTTTRERALIKVKKIRSAVAYQDEIMNENTLNDYYEPLKIGKIHISNVKNASALMMKLRMRGLNVKRSRLRWKDMTSVLTANAFYQPNQNAIIIPIGILQDPFFSFGRPNYINYGSLGAILGHEFTHAFDTTGSLFDDEGNYKNWWTKDSWKSFIDRKKCYINQYNEYYLKKINSHVNGSITLSENIADNGGVQAAFRAYMKFLDRNGGEQKLPGLPYTERQMFWIAFASVWCRRQTDHNLESAIESSVHAPAKYRVNGALSNMKEFAEDFQCEEGSPLNPQSKCSFWK